MWICDRSLGGRVAVSGGLAKTGFNVGGQRKMERTPGVPEQKKLADEVCRKMEAEVKVGWNEWKESRC